MFLFILNFHGFFQHTFIKCAYLEECTPHVGRRFTALDGVINKTYNTNKIIIFMLIKICDIIIWEVSKDVYFSFFVFISMTIYGETPFEESTCRLLKPFHYIFFCTSGTGSRLKFELNVTATITLTKYRHITNKHRQHS